MGYVLREHKKGDTFPGVLWHLVEVVDGVEQNIDLTGVRIRMDVRANPTSAIILRLANYPIQSSAYPVGSLFIDENPQTGYCGISDQKIDINPGTYVFDVEFTFPENPPRIETLIEGTWPHTQDVTHD